MDKESLKEFIKREATFNKIKESIKTRAKRRWERFGYPVEDVLILSEEQIKELIRLIAAITNGFFDISIKQVERVTFDKNRTRHSVFRDEVVITLRYIREEINEFNEDIKW